MCYDGCGAETVQSSLVAETKGSRSTETSGFSAGSMRGETISSATEAWQSLQLAESFWAGTSVVGHQEFLRRYFRLSASCSQRPKTSVFWNGGERWTMGPRRLKSPHVIVWQCLARLKKGKSSPDGVTAEMLLALPEEQIVCLARNIQNMFSSLNFQETWFRVMASLIPQKPHPRGLNEFRPISCLTTFRKLLGYIWLLKLPPLSWKTLQTAFIPHRQGAEAVYMIERCTELAREWSIPVFIAQLGLKKAFDRISHDSIAEMLCRKNLCPQLVAVLCSWWCCSSLEVRLGHVTSDRCILVDRRVAARSA